MSFSYRNLGNLTCPTESDLGEDVRVALCAVTLLAKIDLAETVGFDRDAAYAALRSVHPAIEILEVATRTGAGIDPWFAFIEARLAAERSARIPA